jgi:hypothetical protein
MADEPTETGEIKSTEGQATQAEKPEVAVEAKPETETEKPAEPAKEAIQTTGSEDEAKKPDETPEKRKKSLLAKFSRVGKDETTTDETKKYDANSDGYVSAREAINALNPEMMVESPSEDEVIAQEVAKQLEKQASYFVIRVKKSKLLLTLGLTVLILWLVPLTWFLQEKYGFNLITYVTQKQWQASPTPLPTQEPSPEPVVPRIRIRAAANDDLVASVAATLTKAGFTQTDEEALTEDDAGVTVAVKENQSELLTKLVDLLRPFYPQATGSAAMLTADSEMEAIIILGK